ncbi:hypothetical protein [Pseudoalteromonas sp. SG44-8]|uniref:hypothetical protein n=1 Tax=Pseudoalteromonas sp. SG44-8 TaxID=2760958 RepID=UPI0015FF42DA|nr:hypothetical protein [Pseudoalteromonas sp. SG44-8]MBB1396369.1 hypothetical protein [Pseudoalteromonas sp. SG44-8]
MITNLPEPKEFKYLSIQYLAQAIDHIFKTELAIYPGALFSGFGDIDEEWDSRQGVLGNSLIMLFLSVENFFKYEVSRQGPHDLLTDESREKINSPESFDFENLYLLGLDELISKYQKIDGKSLSCSALTMLEKLRVSRNKFTHGLHRELIEPSYIVEVIAEFLTVIWTPTWISEFREVMLTEPLYGLFNEDEENMQLLQYYKFFEDYLSKKKFKKLIGMPLEGRRYLCPHCQENAIESGSVIDAKYACLEPNQPDTTEVYCWLCHGYAEIERESCQEKPCPANVIYPTDSYKLHISNICLTCGCGQGK